MKVVDNSFLYSTAFQRSPTFYLQFFPSWVLIAWKNLDFSRWVSLSRITWICPRIHSWIQHSQLLPDNQEGMGFEFVPDSSLIPPGPTLVCRVQTTVPVSASTSHFEEGYLPVTDFISLDMKRNKQAQITVFWIWILYLRNVLKCVTWELSPTPILITT